MRSSGIEFPSGGDRLKMLCFKIVDIDSISLKMLPSKHSFLTKSKVLQIKAT